jgi:hypothetical protein
LRKVGPILGNVAAERLRELLALYPEAFGFAASVRPANAILFGSPL